MIFNNIQAVKTQLSKRNQKGRDMLDAILAGIELCYDDGLANAERMLQLVRPDKVFHAINAPNAAFTFSYNDGTYAISWARTDQGVFGSAGGVVIGLRASGTESRTSIVFAGPVTADGGNSFYAFYIDTTYPSDSPRFGIKELKNIGDGEYVLAAFYQTRFQAFGNEWLFTNYDTARSWDVQRLLNPFAKICTVLLGKVIYSPESRTVTAQRVFIAYGPGGEYNTTAIDAVVDFSEQPHPEYMRYIFFDAQNETLSAFTPAALQAAKETSDFSSLYLLCIVYGRDIKWTATSQAGTFFINDKDIYGPQNALTELAQLGTCGIFRRVACCGDSYTSGHIADSGGTAHGTNESYAWPHYMAKLTGNEYLNFGASGASTKTWRTNARGLPALETEIQTNGPVDAFLVGLGINDYSASERHVDVGTAADIGTTADTFYGYLSEIVRELHALCPKAHIFIQNMPRTAEAAAPYNEAMADVAEYYSSYGVHLLDLYANRAMYNVPAITADAWQGHYTAIGYEVFAQNLRMIWSGYINAHAADFRDVAFAFDE